MKLYNLMTLDELLDNVEPVEMNSILRYRINTQRDEWEEGKKELKNLWEEGKKELKSLRKGGKEELKSTLETVAELEEKVAELEDEIERLEKEIEDADED